MFVFKTALHVPASAPLGTNVTVQTGLVRLVSLVSLSIGKEESSLILRADLVGGRIPTKHNKSSPSDMSKGKTNAQE